MSVENKINGKCLGNIYGNWHSGYAGNVWSSDYVCPTLKVESGGGGRVPMIIEAITENNNEADEEVNINIKTKKLGNLNGYTGGNFAYMVYDPEGLGPTINTMGGGGREPMIVEKEEINKEITEPVVVASRGRSPENPSDRTSGIHLEQRLEINRTGTTNAITTVGKDNWVLEPNKDAKIERVGQISSDGSQCGTVVSENGLMSTISAVTHGYGISHIQTKYRIRKLTPKETWRLMGYSDSDFEKAEVIQSNTALYKQAGNGIVRNCLVAIFGQMFEGKEEVYKSFQVDDLKNA